MDEDSTRPEYVIHYYVEVDDDSSTKYVHLSQLQESVNIPLNDISEFLIFPRHGQ